MLRALTIAPLVLLAGISPGAAESYALLQGLDKITARISTIQAPLEGEVLFGSLRIQTRACKKRPPEEPPESAAFLEIIDDRPDGDAVRVFSGWMFASSPALNALEHPVYDIWVLDCGTVVQASEVRELGIAPETLIVPGSGTEDDPGP